MKGFSIAKLVIGILSIVISPLIMLQSFFAGVLNVISSNADDISGSAGFLLAILILTAGIVAIPTRKSWIGCTICGAIYIFAALIGFANLGTFGDLIIWASLSAIFGGVFIFGNLMTEYNK